MRIQHNLPAMNAYSNYRRNVSALKGNLEKLSSGYRINRAGDDAAGLAISEKMRAQITGLETAQKNAKDGISLVQTAEGALTEVHDMLNRMVELATQSANGTYDNETDRAQMQKEIEQLKSEIDRIADSSNFNGINLLDGSMDAQGGVSRETDFTVGGLLPKVGSQLGQDTVLHQDPVENAGAGFSVDFHNYGFAYTPGKSMTVEIGDTEVVLTPKAGATGSLTADGIVDALLNGNDQLDITVDGAAYTPGEAMTIGGKNFLLTQGEEFDSRLTFTQDPPPVTAEEEINLAMEVHMSGGQTVTQSSYTFDFSGLDFADGDKITLAGEEFAWDTDLETTLAQSTKYSVEVSGSQAKLTAKGADSGAAPTLSYVMSGKTVDATEQRKGSDATPTVIKVANLPKTVFETTNDIKVATVDVAALNLLAGSSVTQSGWIFQASAVGDTYTLTITSASAGRIPPPSFTGNYDDTYPGIIAANRTVTPGEAATAASYTIDVSQWTEGALTLTADGKTATIADKANPGATVTIDSKVYDVALANDTLTLTAQTAGTASNLTDLKASFKFSGALTAQVDSGGQGNSIGDYNVSTTRIHSSLDHTPRLASTWFQSSKDLFADGGQLKIGGSTYTFTTDADKEDAEGYVYLGDLDSSAADYLTQVSERLTHTARDNTIYTVGHDGERITLTEIEGQEGFDLTTAAGIEGSLGFTAAGQRGKALTLQIGDTAASYNQLTVSIRDTHCKSLGIDGVDVSTQAGAAAAVDQIKDAINLVSDVRGTLGATQNRLDHTINNLSVMVENIQDAESTIRDTDVAELMMEYTKNNILIQSAQAMLAQANQIPQGVLQLLQ